MMGRSLARVGLALAGFCLAPPAQAAVVDVTGSSAKLGWAAAAGPVSTYGVFISRNGAPFPATPDPVVSIPQVTLTAASGDSLVVKVVAYDARGGRSSDSPASDTLRFLPAAANPTPATPAAALTVSTTSLTASSAQGQNASSQSFTVRNSGGGVLSYLLAYSQPWIVLGASSGSATTETDTIPVSFTTAGLPAGSYTGTITVVQTGTPTLEKYVTVSLRVTAPPVTPVGSLPAAAPSKPPTLELSTATLDVSTGPSQDPSKQVFTVRNGGDGSLVYSVTVDQSWLSVSPASGNSSGEADSLSVSFATARMPAGLYRATLTARATGLPSKTIAVSLRVSAGRTNLDLDGDGLSDLLFRHKDGTLAGWLMNGVKIRSSVSPPGMATSWKLAGTGDFDGDGKSLDLIWVQPSTGAVSIALMDGANRKALGSLAAISKTWRVVGVADFDGDGRSDVLWLDPITGRVGIWLLNGLKLNGAGLVGTIGNGWIVAATGDFDGDRKSDVLFETSDARSRVLWLLSGATLRRSITPSTPAGRAWKTLAAGDFNGDGKMDVLAYSASPSPTVFVLHSTGTGFVDASIVAPVDPKSQLGASGDFDGDGKDDLLWYSPATGVASVWLLDLKSFKTMKTVGSMNASWTVVGEKGTSN
jgi:hypothetical protein